MRVMVLVKATKDSEAGAMPSQEMLEAMMNYNEELVEAGVMIGGDGLKPSSAGVRVHFDGKERMVMPGPFAATNELVAGYWIWEVASMDEAIAWAKKCPNPMPGASDLEIRPFVALEDFGEIVTPEVEAQHERLQREMEERQDV